MKFMWTILACCPVWALGQGKPFAIEGKIANSSTSAKAYLYLAPGKIDSVQIDKDSFIFKGNLEEDDPSTAILCIDKTGTSFRRALMVGTLQIYLEPGKINVESTDSLTNTKVSGTPLNVDNQQLQELLETTNKELRAVMQEYRKGTPAQQKDEAYSKPFDERLTKVTDEQKKIRASFLKTHPNSPVSLDALIRSSGASPEYAPTYELFQLLSPAIQNTANGKLFAAHLEAIKASAVGLMAPDFTQPDVTGKAVSLKDFRGKYVLVDFWASWCGPCRAENPNVVKNYQAYKDKNFTVLGVSLDQTTGKEAWLKAIEKDGLIWTQVSDLTGWKNQVAQKYGVRAIPQNFLIDPQGKIIAKDIRGEVLSKKLAELIK